MSAKPAITLSKTTYQKLSRLLESVPENMITDQLLDELERADIVDGADLPEDVVDMHSEVTFTVQATGKTFTYTLVYPTELDSTEHKLSILSPVGSAIIGLRAGDEIDWPLTREKNTLVRVESVKPSAASAG
ncbi:nucleoside diphosphate kinase regulator [Marinimicrobium alkaliphilum]|uniref:nucleoside diphosphate kinase regulator n=1 Tax=Marinimicrobium alkaliphilum TaxID=2202654 RepID=UPI000DBAD41A|nr:nucleoside diphosphate kinase regulator [Marinimicrobium alkaliphilum]